MLRSELINYKDLFILISMNKQYIYDPPPSPPPKATVFLPPLKTRSPLQLSKKKFHRVEKIYKNNYNSDESNFRFLLSKKGIHLF